LVCACSNHRGSTDQTAPPAHAEARTPDPRSPDQQAEPAGPADLSWLPATTSSVGRLRSGAIAILELLGKDMGGREAECWRVAEDGIQAMYMLEGAWEASIMAFHGAFDRGAIERCAETGLPATHLLRSAVARDADVTRFENQEGEMVLWWRAPDWVVAGSVAQIAALRVAKGTLAPDACMARLLTLLPDQPTSLARCDRIFDNLLGVPTDGWLLGVSVIPRGAVEAQATIVYRSPGEANKALKAVAARRFAATFPTPIRDFLYALPASVDGTHLKIIARPGDFKNIDVTALLKVAEQMRGEGDASP
jgi:hypothetical protein